VRLYAAPAATRQSIIGDTAVAPFTLAAAASRSPHHALSYRTMPPRAWIAIVVMLIGPASLSAQDLAPGSRVRVSVPGRSPLLGTLVRMSGDSVWVRGAAGVESRPLTRTPPAVLEVSRGSRSHTLTGALVGLAVGTLVTVGFLAAFCSDRDTLCDGDEQVRAAALLGLPAVAVGTGIGALVRSERWEVAPFQLGLSLEF
jgi:hypothetical protein